MRASWQHWEPVEWLAELERLAGLRERGSVMSGAQGVVERASAELTRRITGLRRGAERVTSALCGAPDKPARYRPRPPPPPRRAPHARPIRSEDLLQDEYFLVYLFRYFTPFERRVLAQVCTKWRDLLYRSPRLWFGLMPSVRCKELRSQTERARLYASFARRGFRCLALVGASDEDALDLVHTYPLSGKQLTCLSLRCSSLTDRGLEALIDHLQHLRMTA